ncbi:hypothetical protein [Oricola sp.]|uniref:hypothetical protein n=1 Tax=Oricola sp. TaxID=1979950 RepID=UPI003BAA7A42
MPAKQLMLAAIALLLAAMMPPAVVAETIGGDVYSSGADVALSSGSSRNAFVSGFSASLDSEVAGDGHVMGFDVDARSSTGGDLYAIGASVSVTGDVGRDLTASGFTVRLREGGRVAGNARISGGSVKVFGPIGGSLVAAAGRIEIDAVIEGDVRIVAGEVSFGDDARIDGKLVYSSPSSVKIPDSVIDPERVTYSKITRPETFEDLHGQFGDGWSVWPSFFVILFGFVLTIAFLVMIAAVLLAVIPASADRARQQASEGAGASMLAGFFGLAMLVGLVPVSAMTLIGIPLIPVALLLVAAVWIAGYLLGVYAVSLRVAGAFGGSPDNRLSELAVLAAGLVAFAILNFVPFIGWLINFAVVLLGLGAIAILTTTSLFEGNAGRRSAGRQAEPVALDPDDQVNSGG